jgi:glycerate 2-kinase
VPGHEPAGQAGHASRERDVLSRAFQAALRGADPRAALLRFCTLREHELRLATGDRLDLSRFDRILLVGAGKATPRLALALLELLGDRLGAATVTTKDGYGIPLPGIEVWEAGHPLPDARSLAGAADALRVARSASPASLLLCLLSGGASALWAAPVPGVSLQHLRETTDALLRSGAPITDVNTVRKHLSCIAGGQLARAAAGARLVTIAVSDVIGSPAHVIGSGPTVADPSTFADALFVLRSRGIRPPPEVTFHLQRGAAGEIPDTPKPDAPFWARTSHHVVSDNSTALDALVEALVGSGYRVRVVERGVVGEAREFGAGVVREALRAREAGAGREALVWGGETTVTVKGRGRGGRNQEAALAAAMALGGTGGIIVGFFATDGTDGPTEAAGAVVDGGTVERGARRGLDAGDALAANDSYAFLRATGDLLVTGPTGTNVNDLAVALL